MKYELRKLKSIFLVIVFFALFSIAKSSQAATLYVSASGSGSACTEGTPCALSYALGTKCVAGDTIILNSGTYADDISLTSASKHSNLTITTTSAVISALGTFNRGIPSGADNRPYFPSNELSIGNGVTGVNVGYLRMRYASAPTAGWLWVVSIYEPGQTIHHCELWNGTAVGIFTTGPITLSQNYMHDSGISDGDGPDTHTVFLCRNSDCSGDQSADATSWSQKVLIEESTFGGDSDGDKIQFSTGDDEATGRRDNYIEIKNVDFLGRADEQMLDSKGSDYVIVHGCNFFAEVGLESAETGQPIDFVPSSLDSDHWWIYDNVFRPAGSTSYQAINTGHASGEDYFWIWNNVFYNTETYAWASGDQRMVGAWNGMPAHMTFVHNTVVNEQITAGCNFAFVSAERSDSIIRNNLFYNVFQTSGDSGAIFTGRGSSATVTHNYFNVSGCPSGSCTNGSNSVINNSVQLTNAAGGDYTLRSAASVIDKGYTGLADSGFFTPSLDKAGNPRGSSPDIGAYEYVSGGGGDATAPAAPQGLSVQ